MSPRTGRACVWHLSSLKCHVIGGVDSRRQRLCFRFDVVFIFRLTARRRLAGTKPSVLSLLLVYVINVLFRRWVGKVCNL